MVRQLLAGPQGPGRLHRPRAASPTRCVDHSASARAPSEDRADGSLVTRRRRGRRVVADRPGLHRAASTSTRGRRRRVTATTRRRRPGFEPRADQPGAPGGRHPHGSGRCLPRRRTASPTTSSCRPTRSRRRGRASTPRSPAAQRRRSRPSRRRELATWTSTRCLADHRRPQADRRLLGFLGEDAVNVLETRTCARCAFSVSSGMGRGQLRMGLLRAPRRAWGQDLRHAQRGPAPGRERGYRRRRRLRARPTARSPTPARAASAHLEVVPGRAVDGHRGREPLEEMDLPRPSSPDGAQQVLGPTSWPTPTPPGPDQREAGGRTSRPSARRRHRRHLDASTSSTSTSLNDVVERITGVVQRETVPDAWVRAADQIELVDMSPEALRRRMAHGNIYPAERIDAALGNYFRAGNLGALRSWPCCGWPTGSTTTSPTTGAGTVSSGRGRRGKRGRRPHRRPGGDQLVRRASRMALRAKGELIAVHVNRDDGTEAPSTELLDRHRELVEELGGQYVEVSAPTSAGPSSRWPRAENASQIVLGASRRSRLGELLERVGHQPGPAGLRSDRRPRHLDGGDQRELLLPRPSKGGAAAVGAAPLRVGARRPGPAADGRGARAVPRRHRPGSILLLFLALAVAVAAVGSARPGLLAAVSATLLANWFFTPPFHTFTIATGREPARVDGLPGRSRAGVGLRGPGVRAGRPRRPAQAEARTLARLASGDDAYPDRLRHLVEHLVETFDVGRGATRSGLAGLGDWLPLAAAGVGPPQSPASADVRFEVPGADRGGGAGGGRGRSTPPIRPCWPPSPTGWATPSMPAGSTAPAARRAEASPGQRAAGRAAGRGVHDLRTPLAAIKASVTLAAGRRRGVAARGGAGVLRVDRRGDGPAHRAGVGPARRRAASPPGPSTCSGPTSASTSCCPPRWPAWGPGAGVGPDRSTCPRRCPGSGPTRCWSSGPWPTWWPTPVAWSPPGVPVAVSAGAVPGAVVSASPTGARASPTADRERVFRPFQRLGDSGSRNGTGVGLGPGRGLGFSEAVGAELVHGGHARQGRTTMTLSMPVAVPS